MARIFTLIMLFCSALGFSQSNPNYGRLSKACELWGLIKYFNPEQPDYRFDSAFAAQVPKMLIAENEEQWSIVLNDWLSVLKDPNTGVTRGGDEHYEGEIKTEFIKDSILVVTIAGSELFTNWSVIGPFVSDVIEKSRKAKAIIFDLRQTGVMSQYKGYLNGIFDFSGLNAYFSTSYALESETMYYSGFKPENGGSSGGYSINRIKKDFIRPGTYSSKNARVIWIVNEYSELPAVALSQQKANAGLVLSSIEPIHRLLPTGNKYKFSDSITVNFKTEQIRLSTTTLFKADAVYTGLENPIDKAIWMSSKNQGYGTAKTYAESESSVASRPGIWYPADKYPSVGYRVLAAAKIYTIIQNFFPYYQLMDKNWKQVLAESLNEFVNAKDATAYGFAVAKMYANIHDSHGFITGNPGQDQLYGKAPSPLHVDYIENKVVVIGLRNDSTCRANDIAIGDVVVKVNGVSTEKLMEQYRTYYSHSTKPGIDEVAAQLCVRGGEGEAGIFTMQDAKGKSRDVKIVWTESNNINPREVYKMEVIQLINPHIGYADLTRMTPDQTDEMFEAFKNTKAIIFDMRGYPKGTAWSIAPRLTGKRDIPVALFRRPEVLRPNIPTDDILDSRSATEFIQTIAYSQKWKYNGKTVMLINQHAISQAEQTGLFFKAANGTTFIGSATAGANGDMTNFSIPGDMWLNFSGQGVWHLDGRQLQRLGLQPDVHVKPTIKGIRAGRDEVLDKALEWISLNVR